MVGKKRVQVFCWINLQKSRYQQTFI